MSIKCPKCGFVTDDSANFCPNCREPLKNNAEEVLMEKERTCPKCGNKVAAGFDHCPYCMYKLEDDRFDIHKKNYMNNSQPVYVSVSKNHYTTIILGVLGTFLAALNWIGGIYFVHLIGLALGIIGLNLARKDKQVDGVYSKTGYVTSIIAICLGAGAMLVGMIVSCAVLS
ncbi:MAG: zinc ribbon domain-containing protein [Candidatus Izemoplasmatales bacterium]|nr:zinc ribbon domain-containing protein [Candidatus Izemoplasmatales bacterium]MDY0139764.1 zinc ribbon domain-containing protein [Candidatus Izemoplasmatales bacterium]